MSITLRGFTIRSHKVGTDKYADEYQDTWAPAGQLPTEWQDIKQDESVDQAHIYSSSQRSRQAQKRKIIDEK